MEDKVDMEELAEETEEMVATGDRSEKKGFF
jgi:hypothetical protein